MSRKSQHSAPTTSEVNAAIEVHAPVVEVVIEPAPVAAVETPAVEAPVWQPMPNYIKTVSGVAARSIVPAGGPVLVSHSLPTVRPGTARAAALAALQASIGLPRNLVLEAVTKSELAWHKANGRTPANLAPSGWLRTFGAVFALVEPAPVEAPAVEPAPVETAVEA